MSIRKREWVTPAGKPCSAYVVDYFDANGVRRNKQFRLRREAEDWAAETRVDLKQGTHVAERDSPTVADAGKLWLESCEADELEASTLELYRGYLDNHIDPLIGEKRLVEITVPALAAFRAQMLEAGRSHYLASKVIVHLGGLFADAMERGLATRNPVRDRKRKRRRIGAERHKKQLEVGVDIPTPAEIRVILTTAASSQTERGRRGYRAALLTTAAMTGLRISELRGLRWADVDLQKATITVRQRADKWSKVGSPKASASRRTVPLTPMAVRTLQAWKLTCPRRDTGKKDTDGKAVTELCYVFPNGQGNIENYKNIVVRHWLPVQEAAGVTVPAVDRDGNPVRATVLDGEGNPVIDGDGNPLIRDVVVAKYSGFHALRHFFCSWCAARPEDGGLGLPLKTVQVRMGHSTLAMTADRYGHLFPSTDDADVLAAGERALMGLQD